LGFGIGGFGLLCFQLETLGGCAFTHFPSLGFGLFSPFEFVAHRITGGVGTLLRLFGGSPFLALFGPPF